MQTSLVFDFLSAQNLLVPFLNEKKVLADLEKEDLLVLVEKLLNPPIIPQPEPVEINRNFVVDVNYRQNQVKLTHQDVLNKLVKDGVIPNNSFSKRDLNTVAKKLGLVSFTYDNTGLQKRWKPTSQGELIGVTQRTNVAVNFSIEAYDKIKSYLLGGN